MLFFLLSFCFLLLRMPIHLHHTSLVLRLVMRLLQTSSHLMRIPLLFLRDLAPCFRHPPQVELPCPRLELLGGAACKLGARILLVKRSVFSPYIDLLSPVG